MNSGSQIPIKHIMFKGLQNFLPTILLNIPKLKKLSWTCMGIISSFQTRNVKSEGGGDPHLLSTSIALNLIQEASYSRQRRLWGMATENAENTQPLAVQLHLTH